MDHAYTPQRKIASWRSPLRFWSLSGILSLETVVILGFYRPKVDQIPFLAPINFYLNFVLLLNAVLLAAIFIVARRRIAKPLWNLAIILLIFQIYYWISLFWVENYQYYGLYKSIFSSSVIFSTLLCMVAIMQGGLRSVSRFLSILVLYGLLMSLITLLGGQSSPESVAGTAISENYQMASRTIAFGAVISLAFFLKCPVSSSERFVLFVVYIVSVGALFTVGGRTGLVATLITSIILMLSTLKFSWPRIGYNKTAFLLVGASLAGGAIVWNLIGVVDGLATLNRIIYLMSDEQLENFNRFKRLEDAPHYFIQAPLFGHGFGSWDFLEGLEEIYYPHNIVIEIFVELGLVGAAIFGFAVIYAIFLSGRRAGERIPKPINTAIWAYFLVSAFHSVAVGDLSLNFALYSSLALLAGRTMLASR